MNTQAVDRTALYVCHTAARPLTSNQGESPAEARPRQTNPSDVSRLSRLARGSRLLPLLIRIVAGLATVLRCARPAGLQIALTVLLAVPMPATPQVQGSCIGNCLVFSSTTPLSFTISENGGSGEVIAIMPTATDADQDDEHLIYSLWDRDDPIVNGDRNDVGFGDGDAAAFDLEVTYDYQDGKIKFALETNDAYDFETKRVYEFRLVACDNDYNRVYIDITVRINDVNEQLGRPGAPIVEGVSTMKLVVRWTAPDNTGPPITDYDLEYRRKDPVGDWRSWPHNGSQTNAVIMSSQLLLETDYEVRVLARNSEGESAWSLPGTGRTKAASGNPPVFLESLPERSFPENTSAGSEHWRAGEGRGRKHVDLQPGRYGTRAHLTSYRRVGRSGPRPASPTTSRPNPPTT